MAGDPKNPRPDRGNDETAPVTLIIPASTEEEAGKEEEEALEGLKKKETPSIARLKRTVSSTVIRADEILERLREKTGAPPPPNVPRPDPRPRPKK